MKKMALILLIFSLLTVSCATGSKQGNSRDITIYKDGEKALCFKEDGNILGFFGERTLTSKTTITDNNTGITTVNEDTITLSKNTVGSIFSAGIGFVTAYFVGKP